MREKAAVGAGEHPGEDEVVLDLGVDDEAGGGGLGGVVIGDGGLEGGPVERGRRDT